MTDFVSDPASVEERPETGRFVLDFPGGQAFAAYRPVNGDIYVSHTEVPSAFEGRGIASALVEGLFRIARASGRKVIPGCGFVSAWIGRHPEWADVARR